MESFDTFVGETRESPPVNDIAIDCNRTHDLLSGIQSFSRMASVVSTASLESAGE